MPQNQNTKSRKLIIVGLRRSGTTILWKTIRKDKRFQCFDEPFNPHIRDHIEKKADNKKGTMTEYLANPDLIMKNWSTIQPYEECLPSFLGHQNTYLQQLMEMAPLVCIDSVRCHNKIEQIRLLHPDVYVVHLVRDPRAFVTSHLKPYGKWLTPELEQHFFEYNGWFDYWGYNTISNYLRLQGLAFEKLLQIWKYFTGIAELQKPDMTLQFETFANNPQQVIHDLYDAVDLEHPKIDYSNVHPPNVPHLLQDTRWERSLEKYQIARSFVYDYGKQP